MEKHQILLVDDEKAILDVVGVFLETEGFEVIKANNGEDGVKMAKRFIPDAVILDVVMPKMSGYLMLNIMRKDDEISHIPVMLLTATAQMAGHVTLETYTDYKLNKPFEPDEFLKLLRKMLLNK